MEEIIGQDHLRIKMKCMAKSKDSVGTTHAIARLAQMKITMRLVIWKSDVIANGRVGL
jgi:hypothetical protein